MLIQSQVPFFFLNAIFSMKKIGFYMYIVIFSSESTKEKSQECKSRSKRGSINEMGNIKLRDFELTFALLG